MRSLELCAGYGGLALAVEAVFGAETVAVAEWEPAPSRVLAHHWPDVPNLHDITTADWATVGPVDVIAGGTPCQDLSSAGQRRGMRDGTRSGLWSSMLDAVATLRPRFVVWENVRGALSACAHSELEPCAGCVGDGGQHRPVLRAAGRVVGDLSAIGYDAAWEVVAAAEVGAPHRRDRIFVVAVDAADAERGGCDGRAHESLGGTLGGTAAARRGADAHAAAACCGLEGRNNPLSVHGSPHGGRDSEPAGVHHDGVQWGSYEPAIRRWERATGRVAPAPTELGAKGGARLSPCFVEWMMGLPAGWVTDIPGLSRNDQLKMLGNGVVPQQAAHAVRRLLPVLLERAA